MSVLSAKSLSKRWESKAVLKSLDLSVAQGEVYGLLGVNGAGKSTLIRTLIGVHQADSGEATVLGESLWQGRALAAKRKTGYVSEGDIYPAYARVGELLRLERALRPGWEAAGLEAWMAEEKLKSGQKVSALSKGIRKRLELEILLAGQPEVILMDEPLSGLDPVSREDFLGRFMAYLAEHAVTVLLSSHILGDMERLCSRVGVLAGGRIAVEGSVEALQEGGALVWKAGAQVPPELPFEAKVLASRQALKERVWVLADFSGEAPAPYTMSRPTLEEIGVELLRCLDPAGGSHV
jgi:ABC-2 type transport system ATP-binding protein